MEFHIIYILPCVMFQYVQFAIGDFCTLSMPKLYSLIVLLIVSCWMVSSVSLHVFYYFFQLKSWCRHYVVTHPNNASPYATSFPSHPLLSSLPFPPWRAAVCCMWWESSVVTASRLSRSTTCFAPPSSLRSRTVSLHGLVSAQHQTVQNWTHF